MLNWLIRDFFVVETRSVSAPGLKALSSWHEDHSLRRLFGRGAARRWILPTSMQILDKDGEVLALRACHAFRNFGAARCLFDHRADLFTSANPDIAWCAHRVFLWRSKAMDEMMACRALDASGEPIVLASTDYRWVLEQMRKARELGQ